MKTNVKIPLVGLGSSWVVGCSSCTTLGPVTPVGWDGRTADMPQLRSKSVGRTPGNRLRRARGENILRSALLRLLCVQELQSTTHWCLHRVRGVLLRISRRRLPRCCAKHPGRHDCRDVPKVPRLHPKSGLVAVPARVPIVFPHRHLDHCVSRANSVFSPVTVIRQMHFVRSRKICFYFGLPLDACYNPARNNRINGSAFGYVRGQPD